MTFSRRDLFSHAAGASAATLTATTASAKSLSKFASGPFKPTWESLATNYETPDWFRDAKLGLWAHWGPQCQPERGAWYGRDMYRQGSDDYQFHVKTYGHPAQSGFKDVINDWKAERWDPQRLVDLYKAAGAKYFVAMANHHDNLDLYDSKYQEWNTTRIGPKRDIVAEWEKAARKAGLRFGLSNHAAHAWHWYQTAFGYDPEGQVRGLRYDATTQKKADGKGTWWDGLDPAELYPLPQKDMVPPDGITTIKAMDDFNASRSGQWPEIVPPGDPYYVKKWLARQNEMVDKYKPDLVYFDNFTLPLEQAGLDATAYFYNQNIKWNGKLEAVVNGKDLNDQQRRAITEDIERGYSNALRDLPWQTCTCIGGWHYDRRIYDNNGYKSAKSVAQRLMDIVSKNGNLLLSIPIRGNGEIDEKEEKIVKDLGAWMAVNGDAIYATRPWDIYGEGPFQVVEGQLNEGDAKAFTAEDIRFTTKAGVLYALGMDWPGGGYMTIHAMAEGSPQRKGTIDRIELLGHGEPLRYELGFDGLTVKLPDVRPAATPVLKIMGAGLV